ncbi:hypothetical protein HELRODRAFT_63069 [Helobdella robusta]|uniref:chitin synthase n=1 Tax=Helobdella robusta TaxID=6412 RepID=T1FXA7_HELRO|nr:hypothetical protein HELRODRAFT_63069 [Helobdella robusta]ESO13172.1 hypothetical protein HELRODRAFT_63069 [Helobdella robusta]
MYFLFPVWWLSILWISRHLWFPGNEKLTKTSKLYINPLFEGTVLGESIMLNRNRYDQPRGSDSDLTSDLSIVNDDGNIESIVKKMRTDTTPFVYICATMWHENRTEMLQMMKSVFRLDRDQAARRNVQLIGVTDPDYYEFEANIFFDNAMNNHDDPDLDYTANDYVILLVEVVREAAKGVHDVSTRLDDPTKYPTPYGGRLEWTLPGENKLVVHLKDSAKIRHKKRWSQVMYMYYFLGYRLCCDETLTEDRKMTRSNHTFLLSLDGDVDFEPMALIFLIDLMKREEKVGAVCGRIHPIGSGPLVWFQEFEYAIGHWLQKATEHVMGCILCTPGCFSLFRGSAIMDENVMRSYTMLAVDPLQHLQYDQGEDNWLCTLLLQQGYKVEYCAASDSYTYCPEGLTEFFNQRKRWMPSKMTNMLDLLRSWKHTTYINENISFMYLFYQAAIQVASLLSPGIVFMVTVGALNISVQSFSQSFNVWGMAALNALPIILFVVVCMKFPTNIQVILRFRIFKFYIACPNNF